MAVFKHIEHCFGCQLRVGCRLCPYMKMNSLETIRDALANPRADQIITLDEDLRLRAARCIERMFELAPQN